MRLFEIDLNEFFAKEMVGQYGIYNEVPTDIDFDAFMDKKKFPELFSKGDFSVGEIMVDKVSRVVASLK